MMRKITRSLLTFVLPALMFAGFWGCGSGQDDNQAGTGALGLLEPNVQAMNARLDSHYATVGGLLDSMGSVNAASQTTPRPLETGAGQYAAAATGWEAVANERNEYGQDMHRMLNELGDDVASLGGCHMMMGGRLFGSQNAGSTCPSQPYMNASEKELDHHLDEMLAWMNQQDPSGLREEMDRHQEWMQSDIQEMDAQMRQTYGPHGGMM